MSREQRAHLLAIKPGRTRRDKAGQKKHDSAGHRDHPAFGHVPQSCHCDRCESQRMREKGDQKIERRRIAVIRIDTVGQAAVSQRCNREERRDCQEKQELQSRAPSWRSSQTLSSTPPSAEKPPSFPPAARMRWQGMITGIGLAPHAVPTERAEAFSSPATSP